MGTELQPGAVLIDRYEIGPVIGRGSFGVVYQARDRQKPPPGQNVAIKQLPMQSIIDCERQAELRVLLVHPAIPRIDDYFVEDLSAYLVQDLIPGWDLETVLARQTGFLSVKSVLDWGIQLCDFLDYLHNHPVYPLIFRDMKPGNVMVDRANMIHVVDFGLVRVFPPGFLQHPSPKLVHLWKGLPMGTKGYSPPEQYDGFIRPQSDIYALGATLHHLLTRRDPRQFLPFTFADKPMHVYNPAISDALERAVMTALHEDIERRYATASAMRDALAALRE